MWGCIGIFLKLLTAAGLNSMQAVAVRVVLSAVLYTVFLLLTDIGALKIRLRDCWYFIGSGIVSLVFFNWCYFNAITTIGEGGLAVGAVLLYTAPIFVVIMSALFFGEKITNVKIIALIMTFGGCMLVTGVLGTSAALPVKAVLFGLGSGFGYALYSIFGKIAMKRYPAKTVTAYSFIFGAAAVTPFLFGVEWKSFCCAQGCFGAIGISVLCCILPYILYTAGLRDTEAGKASVMATVEPVVATIVGVMYGEMPNPVQIIGMLLVIGAICLMNIVGKEKIVK